MSPVRIQRGAFVGCGAPHSPHISLHVSCAPTNKEQHHSFTAAYVQSCVTAVLPCQSSPSYLAEMSACHQRAAECMVEGAIRNGGIYIKLGQGLCSFNHLLPPEYIRTLQILEDKALNRRYKEVRTATQTRHKVHGQRTV